MSENPERTSRRWLTLRRALVPLACLVVAGNASMTPVLFAKNAQNSRENCARIHAIVKVGGEIIEGGKASLQKYLVEGTISREQYERGVRDTDRQFARWGSADCPTPSP